MILLLFTVALTIFATRGNSLPGCPQKQTATSLNPSQIFPQPPRTVNRKEAGNGKTGEKPVNIPEKPPIEFLSHRP